MDATLTKQKAAGLPLTDEEEELHWNVRLKLASLGGVQEPKKKAAEAIVPPPAQTPGLIERLMQRLKGGTVGPAPSGRPSLSQFER